MYHKKIIAENYEKGKEIMQSVLTHVDYVMKIELYKNRNDEKWEVNYYVPNNYFIKKVIDKQ